MNVISVVVRVAIAIALFAGPLATRSAAQSAANSGQIFRHSGFLKEFPSSPHRAEWTASLSAARALDSGGNAKGTK